MASSSAAVSPMLATTTRVLRHLTPLDELLSAWPSLQQKYANHNLTDAERRMFFDLPDLETETDNISVATNLTRDQLIEKAISNPRELSSSELEILKARFWTPSITLAEALARLHASEGASEEGMEEFWAAREAETDLGDTIEAAFLIGIRECTRRELAIKKKTQDEIANAALPDAKGWIQQLYRQEVEHWGFICLRDAAVQRIAADVFEDWDCLFSGVMSTALGYNGSKGVLDKRWMMMLFDGPADAFAPTRTAKGDDAVLQQGFQDLLKDPAAYEKTDPENPYTDYLKDELGLAKSGILTNTFIVLSPEAVASIENRGWYDNMRVLAFEADYPVPGKVYVEGYQGFTWVRLDQLVWNFYELRMFKEKEVGMDEIWKAAQGSKNQAFVSMDPEEAKCWSRSNGLRGFLRESVIGKRWHERRDARLAREGKTV